MSTAKIIVLRNDGSDGVHFPLPEQRNSLVFGRSVTCDVRIDRNTVSAEHAKMELSPSGQWLLKHLSSSNPTYLNGKELAFPQPLKHGDVFTISKRRFRFELSLGPTDLGENAGAERAASKSPRKIATPRTPTRVSPRQVKEEAAEEAHAVKLEYVAKAEAAAGDLRGQQREDENKWKQEEQEEEREAREFGTKLHFLTEVKKSRTKKHFAPASEKRKSKRLSGPSRIASLNLSQERNISAAAKAHRETQSFVNQTDPALNKKKGNSFQSEANDNGELAQMDIGEDVPAASASAAAHEEPAVEVALEAPSSKSEKQANLQTPRSAKQRSTRQQPTAEKSGSKTAPATKRQRGGDNKTTTPVPAGTKKKIKPNTPVSVVVVWSPVVLSRMDPADVDEPQIAKRMEFATPSPKQPPFRPESSPPMEPKADDDEDTRKMVQILSTVLGLEEYGRKFHHSFDQVPSGKQYLSKIKSKRAMSIGLIKEKVRTFQYGSPTEFLNDWKLLWQNTQDWVPADTTPFRDGKAIYDVVRKSFAELFPEMPETPSKNTRSASKKREEEIFSPPAEVREPTPGQTAAKSATKNGAASPAKSAAKKRDASPAKEREVTPVKGVARSPAKSTKRQRDASPSKSPAKERSLSPAKSAAKSAKKATPAKETSPAKEREASPAKSPAKSAKKRAASPAKEREVTPVKSAKKEAKTSSAKSAAKSTKKRAASPAKSPAKEREKSPASKKVAKPKAAVPSPRKKEATPRAEVQKGVAVQVSIPEKKTLLKMKKGALSEMCTQLSLSTNGTVAEHVARLLKYAELAEQTGNLVEPKSAAKKGKKEEKEAQKPVEEAPKEAAKEKPGKKEEKKPVEKKAAKSKAEKAVEEKGNEQSASKAKKPTVAEKAAEKAAAAPAKPLYDADSDFANLKKQELIELAYSEKIEGVNQKMTIAQLRSVLRTHFAAASGRPQSPTTPREASPKKKVADVPKGVASGKTYTPEKAAQRTASEIDKMPIAELRALCDDMELSSKGTKKDLQMRLREYFKC